MPGKSKKGGGLTVKKSALYKKQGYGTAKSPFTMKGSPLKQDYVKDIYHAKYNPTGTKGKVVKKVTTKAAKTAAKKSFDKWMLGIIKKGGTRAISTAAAYFGSMGTAKATQPGTGGHGGTKVPKLKDIDKK